MSKLYQNDVRKLTESETLLGELSPAGIDIKWAKS